MFFWERAASKCAVNGGRSVIFVRSAIVRRHARERLRVAGAADVEARLAQAAAAANTESIFAFNVEALNGFTM
jgi:hypothetical protein